MDRPFSGQLLLVGEGDFSLSMSLVSYLPDTLWENITSTSLESETSILKHKNASENIAWLSQRGVKVFLNTDATCLTSHEVLMRNKYSRIIFNFPHAGGKSNHKKNRKLLKDFFCSAVEVLSDGGEIYVSLCKGQGGTPADQPRRKWSDSWQIVAMAACANLVLKEVVPFKAEKLPEYSSTGFRSQDKGFNTEGALTHIFVRTDPINIPEGNINISEGDINVHHELCPHNNYIQHKLSRSLHKEDENPVCYLSQQLQKKLSESLSFQCVEVSRILAADPAAMNRTCCHCQSNDSIENELAEKLTCAASDQDHSFPGELLTDRLTVCTVQMIECLPISLDSLPIMHHIMGCVPVSCDGEKIKFICENLNKVVSDVSKGTCKLQIIDTQIHISTERENNKLSEKVGCVFNIDKCSSKFEMFSLNLDKLAVTLFRLPNIRTLWSQDGNVVDSFRRMLTSDPPLIFPTVSLYPLVFPHDMSFWENPQLPFNEQDFLCVIRDVCGDCVVHVELLDRFHSVDLDKVSRCYRLLFQSYDRAMSYNTSWKLQSYLRLCVASVMKVELR